VQDTHIDEMLGQIKRLKGNSKVIENEVDKQNPMLQNLDKEVILIL